MCLHLGRSHAVDLMISFGESHILRCGRLYFNWCGSSTWRGGRDRKRVIQKEHSSNSISDFVRQTLDKVAVNTRHLPNQAGQIVYEGTNQKLTQDLYTSCLHTKETRGCRTASTVTLDAAPESLLLCGNLINTYPIQNSLHHIRNSLKMLLLSLLRWPSQINYCVCKMNK